MSERNVPEVRFKGFCGEWENRKVIDIAPLQRGFDLPRDKMQDGSYPVVMSNGINGYHSIFRAKAPGIITGRSGTIGNMHYIEQNYWPHNTALWVTDFKENVPLYVFFMYQKLNLNRLGTGSGVPTLNRNDVHDVQVFTPKSDEQTRIGKFFKNLDNLIAQNQKKYDKLVNMKKACLGKMFPKDGTDIPELRFKGFCEKWERLKIKDVVCSLTGGVSIAPSDYTDTGAMTIPKGAINSSGIADLSGIKFVSQNFFDKNNSNSASTENIVTSLRDLVPTAPNMGRVVRIEGRFASYLMPQGVYKIELLNSVNTYFIIAYSNSTIYRKIISSEKNGSTQVHIRNGEFLNIKISLPHTDEQTKIGSFFHTLDNLITLRKTELEKLKNIKKACLDKMFI